MGAIGNNPLLAGMLCFMVFVAAVNLIPPLKESITDARSADNLYCDAATGAAEIATCILIEWWLAIFVGASISSGFGFFWSYKRK